jgi:hypothetical protein
MRSGRAWHLALARGVEVHDFRAIPSRLKGQDLVEGDHALAHLRLDLLAPEPGRDREIGDEIDDHNRTGLARENPEDRVDVASVALEIPLAVMSLGPTESVTRSGRSLMARGSCRLSTPEAVAPPTPRFTTRARG